MRLVIVADNALAAEGIRRELRNALPCRVIGYVDGRRPCAMAVSEARPDIVVIDELSTPEAVLTIVRNVRASVPAAKLVLLTLRMETAWLAEVARAGIDAVVAKTVQPTSLGTLVREVAAGNIFHAFVVPPSAESPPARDFGLTSRELEIMRLVAAGASNNRIARELWVTEQTVKFHLSNVYRKLGVSNRTEASHYAYVNGMFELAPSAAGGAPAAVPVAA